MLLGDVGYEGQRHRLMLVVKVKATALSIEQACCNAMHSAARALAERANALKVIFAALGHVSISFRRTGAMTAALLVLHTEHHHTA